MRKNAHEEANSFQKQFCFLQVLTPTENGGKDENSKVTSLENVPINLKKRRFNNPITNMTSK